MRFELYKGKATNREVLHRTDDFNKAVCHAWNLRGLEMDGPHIGVFDTEKDQVRFHTNVDDPYYRCTLRQRHYSEVDL